MAYDEMNIFAKILRGDIPCKKVFEDDFALAFHDINPQAPVHVLVIPKGPYMAMTDFCQKAPADLIAGYFRAIGEVVKTLGLEANGYRTIANAGSHAHQDVPHLHIHILAGKPLGPMLDKRF